MSFDDDENSPGVLEQGIPWELILCNAVRYAPAEVVHYLIHVLHLNVENVTFKGKTLIQLATENEDCRALRDLLNLDKTYEIRATFRRI